VHDTLCVQEAAVEVNHLSSGAAARGGFIARVPVAAAQEQGVPKFRQAGYAPRTGVGQAQPLGKGVCVACDNSGLFLATLTTNPGNCLNGELNARLMFMLCAEYLRYGTEMCADSVAQHDCIN
jgi:hypothetical protein